MEILLVVLVQDYILVKVYILVQVEILTEVALLALVQTVVVGIDVQVLAED